MAKGRATSFSSSTGDCRKQSREISDADVYRHTLDNDASDTCSPKHET